MTRRQIREELFKLIFELDFYAAEDLDEQIDHFFANECINIEDIEENEEDESEGAPGVGMVEVVDIPEKLLSADKAATDELRERIGGFIEHRADIDEKLTERTEGWTIDRIGAVELAILRLCIYEIVYEDLAKGIAINEAVELAKKYGGESSGGFVNGVLARVVGHAGS